MEQMVSQHQPGPTTAPHGCRHHGTAAGADVGKLPCDGRPGSREWGGSGMGEKGSAPPKASAAQALPFNLKGSSGTGSRWCSQNTKGHGARPRGQISLEGE